MKKHNNKGITLIELIVTMAIVVIVGASILSFIIISNRQYRITSAEVDIQSEAQLADNQIHDMLIDVSAGINYRVGTNTSASLQSVKDDSEYYSNEESGVEVAALAAEEGEEVASTKVKKLCFYDWDDKGASQKNIVSIITWKEADQKLYYSTYEYGAEGVTEETATESLMAEYVSDFSVDLNKLESSNQVTYALELTKDGRSYDTKSTVTLRNNVSVNATDTDKIFEDISEISSTVDSVEINPSNPAPLIQGGTMNFSASVYGDYWPSQEVEWKFLSDIDASETDSKPTDTANTTISAGGQLKLGPNETCQTIEVVAISKQSLSENNGDYSKAVKDSVVVATRYMKDIDFDLTSETAGRNQTAKLVFTGMNFNADTFNPDIDFTVTDGSGRALSGVTVTEGTLTTGKQTEQFSYDNVTITCANSVPNNTTVKITATVSGFGSFNQTSDPIQFSTGMPANGISNARIIVVKSDGSTDDDSNVNIKRGEKVTVKAQYRRDGQWYDADTTVKVTWSFDNREDDDYQDYSKCNDILDSQATSVVGGTTTVEALKAPEKLPYDSDDGEIRVSAVIEDIAGNGRNQNDSVDLEFDEVEVESISRKYKDSYVYPAWTDYTSGDIYLEAEVSGIILDSSDVCWMNWNNDSVINTVDPGSENITITDGNKISTKIKIANHNTGWQSNGYVRLRITKKYGTNFSSGDISDYLYLETRFSNIYASTNVTAPYYIEYPRQLRKPGNSSEQRKTIQLPDGKFATYVYKFKNNKNEMEYCYLMLDNIRYDYREGDNSGWHSNNY